MASIHNKGGNNWTHLKHTREGKQSHTGEDKLTGRGDKYTTKISK